MNNKPINILHLQTKINLACGVSKMIYLISKNSTNQFNFFVGCFGGDGLSRFDDIGVKPFILHYNKISFIRIFVHCIKLYSYCKQHHIDIVHSHHRYFDLLAHLISYFQPIKTVTSVHSKVWGKKIFSYKADILIACSKSLSDHLNKNYRIEENRIKVINNFVDPSEVQLTKTKTELMNEINIPKNKFIIGYFGRFDYKEKGIDILLEAFKDINIINDDLFLILIGNGKTDIQVKSFISNHKLSAKVINSRKDIFNYYQILDAFVLPSRIDPFPLVMLEAGYSKTALIASRVDGISELIEHEKDGLLFETENVSDLTQQIIRIIDDKELAKSLRENLYQKIISSYTVNKIVPQYEALYSELLVD